MNNYHDMFTERKGLPAKEKHNYEGHLNRVCGILYFTLYPPIEYPINTTPCQETINNMIALSNSKLK